MGGREIRTIATGGFRVGPCNPVERYAIPGADVAVDDAAAWMGGLIPAPAGLLKLRF